MILRNNLNSIFRLIVLSISVAALIYLLDINDILLASKNIKYLPLFFVVPLYMLAPLLPFSFDGWGVRELSTIGLFELIGVTSELAFTSALLFGFLVLVIGVSGIFFLFIDKKRKKLIKYL